MDKPLVVCSVHPQRAVVNVLLLLEAKGDYIQLSLIVSIGKHVSLCCSGAFPAAPPRRSLML